MKKVILTAICAVAMASCQQQKEIAPNEITSGEQTATLKRGGMRVWHDNGNPNGKDGIDYGCWGSGGNCLPDIVLTPNLYRAILPTVAGGDYIAIRDAFASNRSELIQYISESIVDATIKGLVNVELCGEVGDATSYMLFKNATTQNIDNVYPVK